MVDLELYRAQIGIFQSKIIRIRKSDKCSSTTMTRISLLTFVLFILFVSYVVHYIAQELRTKPLKGCFSVSYNYESQLTTNEIWCHGVCWQYISAANSLCHAIYGNRKNASYKYCAWNCDKGFISENKIDDLKFTIQKYAPHIIGVSEVNIVRNELSQSDSNTVLSTAQVLEKFAIEDYKIFLPDSWLSHNKARVIVYAKEDINVKQIHLDPFSNHLQCINLEVGFGKCKKHFYSFFYREWTPCVSQQSSNQREDLQLIMDNWRNNNIDSRDLITMGDMNLCAIKMEKQGFEYSGLANIVKDFEMEEKCTQHGHIDQ